MSAIGGKANITRTEHNVRLYPKKARNCGCKIALQKRLRKLGQTYVFSWNTI
jgi:hypothetical protein